MAVLRRPDGSVIKVPDNATVREVVEQLKRQGINSPILYSIDERRTLSPNDVVGNRTLQVLDHSAVGGQNE